ncbi:helix-turn-helix transcriptional regulator [Marinicella meishanensis]|uniref:helix-turn-helix transcriptional regulator n=1 Tax=Marinicella meishanensis TaxID=2873263 RepID=UPI001CBB2CB5|nr:helix-turn-helix transcriptional regulator [Marinicella sp. NBU2979]
MNTQTLQHASSDVGSQLKFWRQQKNKSQLELALDVGISTRHLSFVENGKSQPSREMVLYLGQALQLPYRQQNSLLVAAGYAPQFKEQNLDSDALQVVKQSLQQLLQNHNPMPALVLNSRYDVLLHNAGYEAMMGHLLGPDVLTRFPNALQLFFAADGLRPHVHNWSVVAPLLFARVREEAISSQDPWLLDWVSQMDTDELTADWTGVWDYGLPMLTLELAVGDQVGRFFTTIATIGTPLDLTTQEIRLEMLYPADVATAALFTAHAD